MAGIQDAPDRTEISLDGIGVTELVYPVTVPTRDGDRQTTAAAIALYIAMGKEARGAHMSRFVEVLDGNPRDLTAAGVESLLRDLVAAHEARVARVEIEFTFFVNRSAPVSGAESLLACPVSMEARLGDDFDLVTTVVVPVMTVCPCSKEATGGAAHSQRGHVAVSVRTEGRVWIEEIAELVEDCASAPVYPLLKGDDERSVIEGAHEDPVLVEDLVRRVAERLDSDVRICWYRVEAENLDSVHDHNLSAYVERPRSWARKQGRSTMEKKEIGRISHYFGGPGVAAIVLTDELKTGDRISIEGHTTDFEVVVSSMQVEHEQIEHAKAGDNVGIKVPQRVRENDAVYMIIE